MSRTENVKNNIFWGVVNKITLVILPFIMRTAILYVLGTKYLGLSSLFSSILNVLNLAELGFGSALVFSMYKPIAEGNEKLVCVLLEFYKKCYRIIGITVFCIGIIVMPFLKHLISGTYPEDVNLYLLYIIYLFNTVLTYFLFAYKKSLFIASQRADIESNISTVASILQNVLQLLLIFVFKNYYFYVIVLPFITIINNLITARTANKLYPNYYVCAGKLDENERKEIFQKVKGLIFQKIGGVVLLSVNNIIISAYLGLEILAIYNNYYFILTALNMMMSVIIYSLKPSVGNSLVTESVKKNFLDFNKFNFLYVWIVSLCSICLLCLFQPFVRLWVGEKYMFPFSIVVLFTIYFFSNKWCDMLYVYQEAAGIWWENRFVPLFAAVVNLVMNIALVTKIGIAGILISTIISLIFIYDIGYAHVLFKSYFNNKKYLLNYFINQFKYSAVAVSVAIITWYTTSLVKGDGIITFIVKCAICIFIPNTLMIIIYWRSKYFKECIRLVNRLKR